MRRFNKEGRERRRRNGQTMIAISRGWGGRGGWRKKKMEFPVRVATSGFTAKLAN